MLWVHKNITILTISQQFWVKSLLGMQRNMIVILYKFNETIITYLSQSGPKGVHQESGFDQVVWEEGGVW